MRPRLRPHVQITRQHYRGRRWHVVHDPTSNFFYRLNAVAHEFVGLFDGLRTVEEVWQLGLQRHGDAALTQNDVIQLLSQMYSANLLAGDILPETEQLLTRGRERFSKKATQQAVGLMYFKLKLFNPDKLLGWVEPILRPALSKFGFAVWVCWIVAALVAVLPHWSRLTNSFESAVAPSNWGLMLAVYVVLKLWHELGHGVLCKRFGGQVPEFGAMFLVLLPSPYVDASSAWTFANKWKRMAVGAGGMMFELAAAAGAAFVWLNTDSGIVHQMAYNAMLTASVSTVLFNANPLMKFDGYYILSDLLEIPNLVQRSFKMLQFMFQVHLYRIKDATPPTSSPSEALTLLTYGVGALAYRMVIFYSITLYLMGFAFAIGLFLAIWTAAMWFIMPVGKFVHWLATNSQLADKRARAIATSLGLIAVVVFAVGAIPMPDHRRAVGVVESFSDTGVFSGVKGFVKAAHVRAGDVVAADTPILTMESPELEAQLKLARAQLIEIESKEEQATTRNEAAAQVARQYVVLMHEQIEALEEKVSKLVIRAPHAGTVVGQDPSKLVGRYIKEGEPVCQVIDLSALRVTASLGQGEGAWIKELSPEKFRAEVRLASTVRESVPCSTVKVLEGARKELPHAALSYGGGGTVQTDQEDRSGLMSSRPMFKAHLVATGGLQGTPGEKAYVRFTLPSKPLMVQWVDRLQKLLQGRAHV
jgi:putative peptide zinc metalloprotease protein